MESQSFKRKSSATPTDFIDTAESEGEKGTKKPKLLLAAEDASLTNNRRDITSQTTCIATSVDYDGVIADLYRRGFSKFAVELARVNPRGKQDPVSMLTDDLCLHIFSFLMEKPKTKSCKFKGNVEKIMTDYHWLCSKAGQLCAQLRSVSPKWKDTFDRIVPWADLVGLVFVDCKTVHSDIARSLLRWLYRHKIRLGCLNFSTAVVWTQTRDVQLLKIVLEQCQTEELSTLALVIHLDDEATQAYKTNTFGIFYNPSLELKNDDNLPQNNLITKECPNLECLSVSLSLPQAERVNTDFLSGKALFSIPSLKSLGLSIFRAHDSPSNGIQSSKVPGGTTIPSKDVFSNLISSLPNLVHLQISCPRTPKDEQGKLRGFRVESSTLEVLECPVGSVFVVDCPSLKKFYCNAGTNLNRHRNNCVFNTDQCRRIFQQYFANERERQRRGRNRKSSCLVSAASIGSPYLRVPDGCRVTFQDLKKWPLDDDNVVEKLMKLVNENAKAVAAIMD